MICEKIKSNMSILLNNVNTTGLDISNVLSPDENHYIPCMTSYLKIDDKLLAIHLTNVGGVLIKDEVGKILLQVNYNPEFRSWKVILKPDTTKYYEAITLAKEIKEMYLSNG